MKVTDVLFITVCLDTIHKLCNKFPLFNQTTNIKSEAFILIGSPKIWMQQCILLY